MRLTARVGCSWRSFSTSNSTQSFLCIHSKRCRSPNKVGVALDHDCVRSGRPDGLPWRRDSRRRERRNFVLNHSSTMRPGGPACRLTTSTSVACGKMILTKWRRFRQSVHARPRSPKYISAQDSWTSTARSLCGAAPMPPPATYRRRVESLLRSPPLHRGKPFA